MDLHPKNYTSASIGGIASFMALWAHTGMTIFGARNICVDVLPWCRFIVLFLSCMLLSGGKNPFSLPSNTLSKSRFHRRWSFLPFYVKVRYRHVLFADVFEGGHILRTERPPIRNTVYKYQPAERHVGKLTEHEWELHHWWNDDAQNASQSPTAFFIFSVSSKRWPWGSSACGIKSTDIEISGKYSSRGNIWEISVISMALKLNHFSLALDLVNNFLC